jgi:hypothetical protein
VISGNRVQKAVTARNARRLSLPTTKGLAARRSGPCLAGLRWRVFYEADLIQSVFRPKLTFRKRPSFRRKCLKYRGRFHRNLRGKCHLFCVACGLFGRTFLRDRARPTIEKPSESALSRNPEASSVQSRTPQCYPEIRTSC